MSDIVQINNRRTGLDVLKIVSTLMIICLHYNYDSMGGGTSAEGYRG